MTEIEKKYEEQISKIRLELAEALDSRDAWVNKHKETMKAWAKTISELEDVEQMLVDAQKEIEGNFDDKIRAQRVSKSWFHKCMDAREEREKLRSEVEFLRERDSVMSSKELIALYQMKSIFKKALASKEGVWDCIKIYEDKLTVDEKMAIHTLIKQ